MTDWETSWRYALGLPEVFPAPVVVLIAVLFLFLLVIIPSSALVSYVGRKLSADLQARVGPNRTGPAGVMQPLADFLKLLQKAPALGFKVGAWTLISTMTLYSTMAVLPTGSTTLLVDTDVSAFLPFWVVLVLAFATLQHGFSGGSVPGWFSGARAAAQTLSGAFPALIAMLCAGVHAGGFRWSALVAAQGFSPLDWIAFSSPFGLLAFLVFLVSGMAIVGGGVAPMDAGLSTLDLQGGVLARFRGPKLSLYNVGRFYGFFLWCLMASALFLGGWRIPEGAREALMDHDFVRGVQLLELAMVVGKALMLILAVRLVSTVSPKLRADQVTDLTWKVLGPLSLIALAGMVVWVGWGTWL